MSTPDHPSTPPPTNGERLTALEEAHDTLAGEVQKMGGALTELLRRSDASQVQSWLTVDDPTTAQDMLTELHTWVAAVWDRYPHSTLPDCWPLHPWVVEELWVSMQTWLLAERKPGDYRVRDAWHDRGRPGVARRIRESGDGHCEAAQHLTDPAPSAAVHLPGIETIAEQWATRRAVPATTLRGAV